jgi:hypothetical protein
MDWLYGEPTLDEVLSDPTIHAVMNSDGVDHEILRAFLHDVDRAKRSAPRLASCPRGASPLVGLSRDHL